MSDRLSSALRALRRLYRELDGELESLAPSCRMRGLCCEGVGREHHLYASALEIELVVRAGNRVVNTGETRQCPFFAEHRCHVREVRPLGCRLYFCDTAWSETMEPLSVRYHERLRRLIDGHDVSYRYGPFPAGVREALRRGPAKPFTPPCSDGMLGD